jgi:hypothetical protein
MTLPSEASVRNSSLVAGPGSQAKKYTSSSHKASSSLLCPRCHANGLRRIQRKGFWQKLVATRFGYFPWECKICRAVSLFRDRGIREKSAHKD